ncbi:hypothetical protein P1X15_22465 [Runella sp. MFBS21]|uniref:hypothetical protein n=1 Tax=Runella sp. MFBS21 TaxID=3034018 RepID=UPI0023F96BF0|nr:hypothetical protein [Runella sp. MFBS21]MDF7820403.1 hypothetical protein [Runella sp. MFBS21]
MITEPISLKETQLPKDALKSLYMVKRLKQGVWLYFWLLIFEGALRKWVLPGLSNPLLIVRDPIAIVVMLMAYRSGYFKVNGYIAFSIFITFIAFITTLLFGHANLFVALYGARIMLIHFPFLFLIGRLFSFQDVIKIGTVLLWLSVPMTVLIAFQFYSPQSAWVNRGIGGDMSGGGFSGAMGYFRPPGTFSFISGVVLFYGLTSIYVLYFWLDGRIKINKILLISSTIALIAALPLSISRSLFFTYCVGILFAIMVVARKPRYLMRMLFASIACVGILSLLESLAFFQTATQAFTSRFEIANASEGGVETTILNRFMAGSFDAINLEGEDLIWGKGLGMGTNAGGKLLSGTQTFLISEGEWGRLIGENGLILGLLAIIVRSHLLYKMNISAYKSLRQKNILSWLFLSFSFVPILQGQWAQPTSLGFSVLAGGLLIASLKRQ